MNSMNRHEMRVLAMQCVYQHLLLKKDIRKCLFDALEGQNEVDGYLYSLTITTCAHEDEYIQKVSEFLRDDWTFDRLSLVEQAILLISCQEILDNETSKPIVINEAVTLAKAYCDENSYKMINGVLDRL